jgi:hypothetical protein
MSKSKIELIVVPVVLFFGIMYFMVFVVKANRSEALAYRYMLNNLRRINIATKNYATEVSGKMPDAKDWADQIITSQSYILKEDFVTPYSYPKYGILYNASFEGIDISEIDANSVILFVSGEGKVQWNSSGTKETFLRLSSLGRPYLITWNSEIYRYESTTKTMIRISDDTRIKVDDLIWENVRKN